MGAAAGSMPGAAGAAAGGAKPAPAKSVSISAETSANTAPADYTAPGLLLGSGALLIAWLALTLWIRRHRGEHL